MADHMSLEMDQKYLDKQYCKKLAGDIIWENKWDQVSQMELAKEIYGHAFVFYKWEFLEKLPIAKEKIYDHTADGIDIENKLDRYHKVWDAIWNL